MFFVIIPNINGCNWNIPFILFSNFKHTFSFILLVLRHSKIMDQYKRSNGNDYMNIKYIYTIISLPEAMSLVYIAHNLHKNIYNFSSSSRKLKEQLHSWIDDSVQPLQLVVFGSRDSALPIPTINLVLEGSFNFINKMSRYILTLYNVKIQSKQIIGFLVFIISFKY